MPNEIAKQELQEPVNHTSRVVKEVNQWAEKYEHPDSAWDKLFNKERRRLELAKCTTVEEKYAFELRVLQTFHDAQIQVIQEMYNEFLIKGKAELRKDRAEFFQEQMNDLVTVINEKSRDFLKKIELEYKQLEEISVPFLRKKQETFIEESVDRYYETLNQLQDNFRNILNEEVHDTRGSLTLGKPRTKKRRKGR